MIHGVKDQPVKERFTVSDSHGNLISGIDTTAFTAYLYTPDGVEVAGTKSDSFNELGDGNYEYVFTPNANGVWYVNVINSEYFPWGKNDDIYINESDLTGIYEIVRRTLGLVHHNIYIDDPIYDEYGNMISARVRVYSDTASVGTGSNIIETYKIEADGTQCGQFSFWKQVVNP